MAFLVNELGRHIMSMLCVEPVDRLPVLWTGIAMLFTSSWPKCKSTLDGNLLFASTGTIQDE